MTGDAYALTKNGQVALVTGGSRNIGFEISRSLSERGYTICLTSRSEASAEEARTRILAEQPDADIRAYTLEQGSLDSIEHLFGLLREEVGRLDLYVANAADLGVGLDIFSTGEAEYDRVMDTNVKGTFFCAREAARMMAERRSGNIVLLSSIQSKGAVEGRTVYAASKAAINSLTQGLAFDLAPYGIRVNCIIAGAVSSLRWDRLTEDERRARRQNYPLGRESEASAIADAVYYLGSETSRGMTGSELTLDSGVGLCILPYRDRRFNTGDAEPEWKR